MHTLPAGHPLHTPLCTFTHTFAHTAWAFTALSGISSVRLLTILLHACCNMYLIGRKDGGGFSLCLYRLLLSYSLTFSVSIPVLWTVKNRRCGPAVLWFSTALSSFLHFHFATTAAVSSLSLQQTACLFSTICCNSWAWHGKTGTGTGRRLCKWYWRRLATLGGVAGLLHSTPCLLWHLFLFAYLTQELPSTDVL